MNPHIDIEKDEAFMAIHREVKPYTITSIERQYGLYQAVRHVQANRIAGEIVECGVWKGGSIGLAWLSLESLRAGMLRGFWLFDTFAGMTSHGPQDKAVAGVGPEHFEGDVLAVSRADVERNLAAMLEHIPQAEIDAAILYVQGDVQETLREPLFRDTLKERGIAVLHLDTDWYESTKIELEVLYPLVAPGGVVIADDYGHWLGQGKAVDEYLAAIGEKPLLHRLDYSGRMWVKPSSS